MEGDLGYGAYLLRMVEQAIDAGDLGRAEQLLELAETQVATIADSAEGAELRVTAMLLGSTVAQHRLGLDRAQELGEQARAFARGRFGEGIQTGRAGVRLNYVGEARGRWAQAQEANFALATKLEQQAGSGVLRLNCFTRALACATKNAARGAQERAVMKGLEVVQELDAGAASHVLAFFFYWCAFEQIRQYNCRTAREQLRLANQIAFPLGSPTWRWRILVQFAVANLHEIAAAQVGAGRALLDETRQEAAEHGYLYLVEANEQFFRHLER